VRHELRNKFTSMKAALFLLKRRAKEEGVAEGGRALGLVDVLGEEVVKANELLSAVPPVGRPRRFERVGARECLEHAVDRVALPKGVRIELRAEPAELEVEVDAAEIVVAVRSVVDNAVEAVGDRGMVVVTGTVRAGTFVVEVRDGGGGIPEAARTDVLRAFHTTKDGHLGLGLNVARRAAERYGGDLVIGGGGGGARAAEADTTVVELTFPAAAVYGARA
jgi:signal transduction histidine kinase